MFATPRPRSTADVSARRADQAQVRELARTWHAAGRQAESRHCFVTKGPATRHYRTAEARRMQRAKYATRLPFVGRPRHPITIGQRKASASTAGACCLRLDRPAKSCGGPRTYAHTRPVLKNVKRAGENSGTSGASALRLRTCALSQRPVPRPGSGQDGEVRVRRLPR